MDISLSLSFDENSLLPALYGAHNHNLSRLEQSFAVDISSRGKYIAILGETENVKRAASVMRKLYALLLEGRGEISVDDLEAAIKFARNNEETYEDIAASRAMQFTLKTRKKSIFPYTDNQHNYLELLHKKDVIFGIGAAGTGKTFLAVATAVSMFLQKQVNKIILTRPAVEAGEKLGFLPGDMKEKVDPYLRPLYDALYEMLPVENVERYFATQEFQIAPLAFMRGRTLSNAFVILDEAQNATPIQMKMFLTRLGYGSKMAITGDLTQIDLPKPIQSGLIDAIERLKNLEEIGIIRFDSQDVVRHPLTAKIIDAYEQN